MPERRQRYFIFQNPGAIKIASLIMYRRSLQRLRGKYPKQLMLLSRAKDTHYFKEKKYSNRSWDEVMQILRIPGFTQGDVFSGLSMSVNPEDLQKIVDSVMVRWNELAVMMGFPGNKEKKCLIYVANILQTILPIFPDLHFDVEYMAKDEQFGGEMDMVIHAYTPSKIPVVYIVEAKKYDIDQGRAQLYPQMKLCHELARKEEKWDYPIFKKTIFFSRVCFINE